MTKSLAFDYFLLFSYFGLPSPISFLGLPLLIALKKWKIIFIISVYNLIEFIYHYGLTISSFPNMNQIKISPLAWFSLNLPIIPIWLFLPLAISNLIFLVFLVYIEYRSIRELRRKIFTTLGLIHRKDISG